MKKGILIFLISVCVISIILFLFNIPMFDGEILMKNGTAYPAKLSLSYFIGIGVEKDALLDVQNFYLISKGYVIAGITLIGIPALIAYRFRKK